MKSEKAKVLHPVLGRPLCAYPVSRAFELGASPVVAVVGHQANAVERALQAEFAGRALLFALQAEQRGTADAVRTAQGALATHRGPVLILYGDTPLLRRETLEALVQSYEQANASLAMITVVPPNPTGYGRVVRQDGQVQRVVEQKDCSSKELALTECNAGIYAIDSEFLWSALARVESTNAQAEFYLTDLVAMAAKLDKLIAVPADFSEAAGVNDRAELAACAKQLQTRINLAHMRAGVSLQDPDSTFIEDSVVLDADVDIEPMVSLRRHSRVARGARIGQGCVLVQSVVGEGTEIRPYSILEEANVGKGCLVGPFARLRPESRLEDGVHIGNFVETKKTIVGKGSKANHLSYLGDAEIGAGVNVGAGTITCNYDGKNKFKTILEDHVFVGSDTQLVAPVRVGTGAYIAAGTTVTEDVPAMGLALSRSPQVVKEGWVTRKKAQQTEQALGPQSTPKGKAR